MNWYALRVSPVKEFAVEMILRSKDLQPFLPIEIKYKRVGCKKKRTRFEYAMLPRYVFVRCSDPWSDILRQPWSRNVQGVVSLNGLPAVIPEAAIARLAKLSGRATPTSAVPVHKSFNAGEMVRVARGPLQSKLVRLEEIKGQAGVILTSMLGSEAMPVEISLEDLEAA